jgi:diacylglycerol kinase family enzyme
MRMCLFWNSSAGGGNSEHDIASMMVRAGHSIERIVERPEELRIEHLDDVDCVVAAGGDGTVAPVARLLAGTGMPMAILPLGTANNVAASLGISGATAEIIAGWSLDRAGRMDIGLAEGARFLESCGCGLVADCITEGRRTLSKDDPAEHLADARQLYVERLQEQRTRPYQLTIDGEAIEGDYLLIEVLNTPVVGPGIELAGNVAACDGALSVVMLGESDRASLHRYLTALRDGRPASAPFNARPAKSVTINGAERMHIDSHTSASATATHVSIQPASLRVLV